MRTKRFSLSIVNIECVMSCSFNSSSGGHVITGECVGIPVAKLVFSIKSLYSVYTCHNKEKLNEGRVECTLI